MPKLNKGQIDSYLKLIKKFPLTSIKTDKELSLANKMIVSLFATGQPLDEGEEQYLDALSDLVRLYEEKHVIINRAPPGRVLASLLEDHNLTATELSKKTGIPVSTISEIVHGKRGVSRPNMQVLGHFFRLSPLAFFAPDPQ